NQVAPDYLEGLLLVSPGEHLPQHLVMDIAKIAALMHRAADLDHEPAMREVKYLLPRKSLLMTVVRPQQWVNMVQGAWPEAAKLSTTQAKAQVMEILQHWELFGSAFFTVKRVLEGQEPLETILALNKRGVHFLDYETHETLEHYSLSQVFSTRKVKSEDGYLYLDMKFGNLLHHRICRIQTIQAHEISRLFRQYIGTEQRVAPGREADAPRDLTLIRDRDVTLSR
ncbi:PH domain-like, partial [Trinorchestia longiramus]